MNDISVFIMSHKRHCYHRFPALPQCPHGTSSVCPVMEGLAICVNLFFACTFDLRLQRFHFCSTVNTPTLMMIITHFGMATTEYRRICSGLNVNDNIYRNLPIPYVDKI